ncbi:MAG: DNA polymerase III subunit alpha [Aquisalinus sp.]|nr:DNA polymerase III subunit alpha [Aquisalinus sp.]
MQPFIHLHLHSSYSLAEGAIHVKRLKDLCLQHEMPAVAVTDTNNLFGALEASETLSAAGIQSITGIQLALNPEELDLHPERFEPLPSLVLLAQNEQGYQNLMKLTSQAYLSTAAQGAIHTTLPILEQHTEGLICLSGGINGPVDRLLVDNRNSDAAVFLKRLATFYPDRLYVEVQRIAAARAHHKTPYENELLQLAYTAELPLVATNEPFFAAPDDYEAHDALLCISGGAYIQQDDRRKVMPDNYFRSGTEMVALFEDLPEAIENTSLIARRCAFRPRTHPPILPNFVEGDVDGEAKELERQAREGLKARLEQIELAEPEQEYWKRLDVELGIINNMGFPGYFLIVSDFIKWAKQHDIPVGPGRGSGAGSVVAWALTITNLDPLRFGLLFERFLNPERVSMPDFDVDFCQDRRDEVISYVQDKYGKDRVAQIITFGKLQARAVLRDVGRVLNMPFGQVDRLCKMVPNNPANPVTLAEAIETEPRLQQERDSEEQVADLMTKSLKLEGLYRHASTHAAGVVIGDRPLDELVPLYLDPRSDMPATQFNMKWVEPAGLVKFDFLGLKTLTVIQRALDLMKQSGTTVDIDAIPLDDRGTFEMLGEGNAVGVFQLESTGMRSTLKGLKPDTLEDIIALVSLYRPGPMENIPTYIERKFGREEPDYLHEKLTGILKETYGVIIYQEQVMQIAQILSGYSLGEADLLRRAMGKKKKEEMDKQKIRFVEGAEKNNVDKSKAESIFELVAKFAGYGFNKSHAAAYALIAYQTAWLKHNHTAEFFAASMSLDKANTDKLAIFMKDARRCEIEVKAPDVNLSEADFTVHDGAVVYALAAIKNVGEQAMAHIAQTRKEGGAFTDLYDFAERVDGRQIGKRGFENLAKAGAFDSIHKNRAQIVEMADFLVRYSAKAADERNSDQGGLFDLGGSTSLERPALKIVDEWLPIDRLDHERAVIGFYFSGHPLDDYASSLEKLNVIPFSDVTAAVEGEGGRIFLKLAGVIRAFNPRRAKSGKPFAWVELSDQSGEFEITVFSELLETARDHLQPGTLVMVGVSAEERDGDIRLTGETIQLLDKAAASTQAELRISVVSPEALNSVRKRLYELGTSRGGSATGTALLHFFLPDNGCEVELKLPGDFNTTAALKGALKTIDGVSDVELR